MYDIDCVIEFLIGCVIECDIECTIGALIYHIHALMYMLSYPCKIVWM